MPTKLNLRGGIIKDEAQDSAAETTETPVKAESSKPVENGDPNLKAILENLQKMQTQLDSVQQENAKLKEFSALRVYEAQKDSKERYNGPRAYSYKLYYGKPICSLKMTRNENLLNANSGRYVANQMVELTYADGEKEVVDYANWASVYTTSGKVFPKTISESQGKHTFTFEVYDKTFTVDDSAIN